jgi:hypothetical protein
MPRAAVGDYLLELAGDPDAVARFFASADFARSSMARAGLSEAAQSALISGEFLKINRAIADDLRSLAENGDSIAGLSLASGSRAEQQIAVSVETQVETHVETHVEAHVETDVQIEPDSA